MLVLDEFEKDTVQRLLKEWGYHDDEPDCCGTALYHFEVIPSGIGDNVYLCYKEHKQIISNLDNF